MVLTEWEARRFRGGETMILRPGVLDYWGSMYRRNQGLEQEHLVQLVEPHFNRLTVFDPRCDTGNAQAGDPWRTHVCRLAVIVCIQSPHCPGSPPPGRFPHGVRPVFGTRDPREARLVLHGEQLGNQGGACLACRPATGQIQHAA